MYLHPLLASLPDTVRKLVSDAARLSAYRKGEVVLQAGETATHMFCVASGLLRIVSAGSVDGELTTGFLKPDEIYLGGSLLDAQPHPSDVTLIAALPSDVYKMPKTNLVELCTRFPVVALRLMDMMLTKDRALRRWIRRVATLSAEQIVARALYELTQAGPDGARAIDKRIPQSVIASYSGLSRPVVNRVVKDLESRGLLRRNDASIVLSDEIGAFTDFGQLATPGAEPAADAQRYAAPDLELSFSDNAAPSASK